VVHLEGKLRKAESELQKSVDSARVLKDEIKRLARSLETREDKISALHTTVRTLHKEARAKEQESEIQEVAAVNADYSSSLEGELRKRAAMVSSQEIAIEKLTATNKSLECKVRLLSEQQKRAMALAKEAESSVGADASKLESVGQRVSGLKQKLRATEEALQFTTDELDAREVEVAQLRVSRQEADEQVADWRTQKDDIDRKIRHSSTALRNVLKDKVASPRAARAPQRESYRVGPKFSSWPKILTANPY
jgi:chromosome segregation ATPase